jgi:hypothetical protein
MVGYITKSAREINKALVEFLPELDSEYARYPMTHQRWYGPNEKGPKGEPCFIPHDGSKLATPIKKDYVYCKKGLGGKGYYSLMTRTSYVNLHDKLGSVGPQGSCVGCPCFAGKGVRDALDRYDDAKRVIYMRQNCIARPDDKLADDVVMGQATQTAQNMFHATQNEQLLLHAVGGFAVQ